MSSTVEPFCEFDWEHSWQRVNSRVFECRTCNRVMVIVLCHCNELISLDIIGRPQRHIVSQPRTYKEVKYFESLNEYLMEQI